VTVRSDILPPRYHSLRQIGSGGMGDIFRATDSALHRDVAVKLLAERYAADLAVRERFTREALAAARLSGRPNIVTIYDVGEHKGRPYIVMEHLSGGSLDDVLREEGAQGPERVLPWLEEAAGALDNAHRAGIVHRDVKPANLMLDREGHVHVADFGIASAAGMDSLTMTGTILGTAGYLAPEQALGERAVPASDRYALAVAAWELLTGRRPYEAESPTAEASAHVSAPIPSISGHRGLPRELDPVFARALAKDPAERYATAGEFVAALRSALADAAGSTRELRIIPAPTPPRERRTQAGRHSQAALAVLLGAGALAGAGLAVLLTRGDGGHARTEVVTRRATVTKEGRVTTVQQPVTVTTSATTAPSPATGQSGAALNNAGYAKMRAGDYAGALPLLEQAVRQLQGTGSLDEAYASYNLAFTRFAVGNCDGVLDLLNRSESVQGRRKEIDRLRHSAEKRC
jgi:eukaryotic-like serine/threonine-protein kinase